MCIVNTTHKFVFVHIPKTAGTTVTTTLSQLTTLFDLEIGGTPWGEKMQTIVTQRFSLYKHSTAAEIRGTLGVQEWARYLTFAFVRNPYDRAWSTYKYLRQHKGETSFAAPFKTFDAFVLSERWDEEGPSRMLSPQVTWTDDRRGTPVVNLTGRVERLDQDLSEIVTRLGPAATARCGLARTDIVSKNVSRVPRKPPVLSARAVEKIANRYARDFERFGYDPGEKPFPQTD